LTREVLLLEVSSPFRAKKCSTSSSAFVGDYLRFFQFLETFVPIPFLWHPPLAAKPRTKHLPQKHESQHMLFLASKLPVSDLHQVRPLIQLPFHMATAFLATIAESCEVHDLPFQAGSCQESLSPSCLGLSVMPELLHLPPHPKVCRLIQ